MTITAEHSTLGPGRRSGVQEGCLDVADQAQDQWPWIWANAMPVAGFLDDGDLAYQHPNRVLTETVCRAVLSVLVTITADIAAPPFLAHACTNPTNAVIGIMAGAVKAGEGNAACQPS